MPNIDKQSFIFQSTLACYKNGVAVLAIWQQLHCLRQHVHLLCVYRRDSVMHLLLQQSPLLVHCLYMLGRTSEQFAVRNYIFANSLLYASHLEGYSWSNLEAMICGFIVIPADRVAKTELGGVAVITIPAAPPPPAPLKPLVREALRQILQVRSRRPAEQERIGQQALPQARRSRLEPWLVQPGASFQHALALQERRRWPS